MVTLYSKFENISEEKKNKILEVCIEEFARNGYENASTNTIVKNSGISKGILFHYFGNKKNLYLYVVDHALNYITEYVMGVYDKEAPCKQADIFEKIMHTGLIKIRMAYEFPDIYKLVLDAYTHTPAELSKELMDSYNKVKENIPIFLKDIDTSKFRKGIDVNKAIELIHFSLEGVSNKYMKVFQSMKSENVLAEMDNILKEYGEYIEILKSGIYEKEE